MGETVGVGTALPGSGRLRIYTCRVGLMESSTTAARCIAPVDPRPFRQKANCPGRPISTAIRTAPVNSSRPFSWGAFGQFEVFGWGCLLRYPGFGLHEIWGSWDQFIPKPLSYKERPRGWARPSVPSALHHFSDSAFVLLPHYLCRHDGSNVGRLRRPG